MCDAAGTRAIDRAAVAGGSAHGGTEAVKEEVVEAAVVEKEGSKKGKKGSKKAKGETTADVVRVGGTGISHGRARVVE